MQYNITVNVKNKSIIFNLLHHNADVAGCDIDMEIIETGETITFKITVTGKQITLTVFEKLLNKGQ
jgi:hypothetical protein